MRGPPVWCVQPLFGAVAMEVSEYKVKKGRVPTFRHFPCQYCIQSSFLMAWCIVKKKESPEVTFEQALKNIDGGVDLREEIFRAEIAIAVLASFEDNPSFPENKSRVKKIGERQ